MSKATEWAERLAKLSADIERGEQASREYQRLECETPCFVIQRAPSDHAQPVVARVVAGERIAFRSGYALTQDEVRDLIAWLKDVFSSPREGTKRDAGEPAMSEFVACFGNPCWGLGFAMGGVLGAAIVTILRAILR
jgi:hypothetical protein